MCRIDVIEVQEFQLGNISQGSIPPWTLSSLYLFFKTLNIAMKEATTSI